MLKEISSHRMTFPWDNVLPPRQDIKNCALVVVERNQEESLSGVWWFAQLMKIHSKRQNMYVVLTTHKLLFLFNNICS